MLEPRGRRTGTAIGIAFAVSLFAATGAQAQNCVIPSASFNLGGIASSPASVSSVIGSSITAASTAFLLQSTAFIGSPPNPQPDQEGAGIWIRGVGGNVDVKSSTTTFASATAPPGASGTVSCFQKVDETFAGVQFGRDLAILNVNGWNFHWGVTAGYLEANSSITGGAVSFPDQANPGTTAGGGPFNSTTNVPFIGAYAAATYNGFSVDALLRTEYYQTSLNAPGVNLFNQEIDAHGITFAASAAYQWQVPNSNWFIEPSAGIIISRIKVDPFNYLTAGVLGPRIDDRINGTLQLNDIKSDIGRLGLRFGTTINAGNVVWQPFGAVSVWHEFGPNITSNYVTCPGCVFFFPSGGGTPQPVTISAASSTTNIGTFGQYSLGVSASVPGTGWLGFARVDFRDGPNLEGWSGTGGIRYQFTPEGAPNRPLPIKTKAPPPPVVEAINWTGFYIGAFGGATQGTADWGYIGGEVSPHIGGFIGGGNIGYNYQVGRYVLGVEGDLAGTNTIGGTSCGPLNRVPTPGPMFQMTCNVKADWLATLTARLGYTWERALFYVKGGGAWTDERFSATCNTASVTPPDFGNFHCTNPAGVTSNGFTADTNRTGWVLGFGTEFAFTRNWSAKAETDYISFGDTNLTASDGSQLRVGIHVWEEKIGVNYRF